MVLYGHQRGVQGVAGQLHDGTAARRRVHADGPDPGLGPDHGGHAAVYADNERDDGHHADIADVHAAAADASARRFRARHRPTGGPAGHSRVRGETVHVLFLQAAGQAHQG